MASIYGLEKQWIFLDSFFFLSFILSLSSLSLSLLNSFYFCACKVLPMSLGLLYMHMNCTCFCVCMCVLVFVNCGCSCTTIREIFSASRQNIFSQLAEGEWGSGKEWAKEREGETSDHFWPWQELQFWFETLCITLNKCCCCSIFYVAVVVALLLLLLLGLSDAVVSGRAALWNLWFIECAWKTVSRADTDRAEGQGARGEEGRGIESFTNCANW